MKIDELKNKKIAILWFWKEGQSSLKFLQSNGIDDITVLDKKEIVDREEDITYIDGDWYLDELEVYDIIIKSPWISPFSHLLLPYREKFVSQTQIFFSNYRGKVIWITWTKWKSTISTLLYNCLHEAWYDVRLVWNIWSPVLDEVSLSSLSHDYIIYELSSFMLQDFQPELYVWYINNIFPCHLDWHFDSMKIYKEAKVNILVNASTKILHWDLFQKPEIASLEWDKTYFDTRGIYNFDEKGFFIGEEYIYNWDVKLLWDHNRKNICWVIAILDFLLKDKNKLHDALMGTLPHFSWLENRIENIGTYEWITFINDAIATTPQSTMAAIETFWNDLETLFLWWENSWFEFGDIRTKILKSDIRNIIAFPDTSELIFPEISIREYEKPFEIEIEGKSLQFIRTKFMKTGVDFAYKTTLPGKYALLSCAAPSFSLWNSYLDKAQEFKNEVINY